MKITATTPTFLKKKPIQSTELPDSQKVEVEKDKTYPILKISDEREGHRFVELEHSAGSWWIFSNHWKIENEDDKPETPDGQFTGIVTATFTMNLKKTRSLVEGLLTFKRGNIKLLEVVATSGAPGFQYEGAWTIKGRGCIPPAKDWKISTNGYYLPTKGIEGQFYHITPDPRFGRSQLGLHRDSNYDRSPGSAGCIVVIDSDIFNRRVVPLFDGLKKTQANVNLSVVYS
jgi:hypothetical protein